MFYTKHSAQLNRPYLQYKDEASAKIDPTTKLTYKSDSNSPEINHAKLIAITPDATTVYRSFEWGDVKDEENAATLYFTDNDLTSTAHPTAQTSDDTIVYRSFTWSTVKTQTNAAKLYFIDKGLTRNPQSEALETLDSSCNVGGKTRNLVQLQVSAKEGNGIKKIIITANGVEYDSTKSVDGTVKTESGNTIFTTKKIDLTNVAEGSKTVTIMVYDNCDLNNKQTTSFYVDRTAPEISISTPASDGQTYYGTIKQNVAAGIISGGDTDTKVYFTVSEDDDLEDFEGIDMSSAVGVSASIVFDGGNGTNNGYHTKTLHNWIKELRASDTSYNIEENDDNVPLYIWYKAVDSCGNFSLEKRLVNVIPNGDKPTVSISYPEYKADSNGNQTVVPALAGTIRLYGTTDIQAYSVDSVYIQIASNYTEDYDWDAWLTDLATVSGSSSLTVVDIPFTGTKQVDEDNKITYINNKKGIKASGTPDNWNLPINSDGIFETVNRNMAIRVFAVSDSGSDSYGNNKGKVSDPVVQAFNIDKTAPRIGGDDSSNNRYSVQLVQFESGSEGNMSKIIGRAAYKSDMWVTGNWYLLASVYDDNGIKSILLDENKNAGKKELVTTTTVTTVDSKECFVTATDKPTDATETNYNIVIPLPTGVANTSGSVTYTIEATEDTDANLSSVETIKINYDNTPPKVSTKDYKIENEAMVMNPQVYDEDGFYKLKGYVSDAGGNASGLFGVAFYFVRRGSKNCVYDPMYYRKNSVSITDAKDATASDLEDDDIVYANGLYWKHKTLDERTDSLTEIKLSAKDDNIHKGGLVMLGGKIYKIKKLSADGKTITLNDGAPKSIETANFALAMVVDNRSGETQTLSSQSLSDKTAYGYGYCATMTDDDGDKMLERLTGDVEGRWEASIYSKNIKDGPIEIHYVAFDQAQNYTVGIVGNVDPDTYKALPTKDAVDAKNNLSSKSSTAENLTSYYQYYYDADNLARISNNAPRIASVTVGTDFNGNGTIEDSEKSTEYSGGVLSVNGSNKAKSVSDSWILSSDGTSTGNAKFIIKDMTTVGFEIIGGNTNIYYQYSIDDTYKTHAQIQGTDGSAWTRDNKDGGGYKPMTVTRIKDDQNNEIEGKDFNDDGAGYYNASTVAPIEFRLQTIESKVTSNKTAWWTIELWDETEDTTIFTNSQYATLKLPLNVQVRDDVAPNTVISDLYWNGSGDNSVYKNVNGDLFGHVELVKDIGSSQLGTTYGTTDDKVSGVVVFRGFAYDNKRLSQLDWAIVDSTGKSILPNAASGISYNTGATFSTNGWSSEGDLVYDSTEKKVTGTYKFTVKTAAADGAYLDAKGHKVAWELAVDTSAINGVVAKDAKLYVRAKDDSGSTTTQYTDMAATGSPAEGVTDQEAIDKATKKPTYQVDILPYITGVQTRLSSLNADGSLYGRTALGHYPIGADETSVILQGYNLAADNGNVTLNATTISGLPTGEYQYTVSGTIKTINNLNNNDAHGDYDLNVDGLAEKTKVINMYNRQPNTTNNLTMTDDVYFDMWEFNPTAAMPTDGAVSEPVMKINPATNVIGFAFASGTSNFCMPDNNNSYRHWQKSYDYYTSIGLTYDTDGYSYAVAAGADCNDHQADLFNFLSSRWGKSKTNGKTGSISGEQALRLESIGQTYDYDGTPGIQSVQNEGGDVLYIDKKRIQSPSLATGKINNNETPVYLLYYDNINDEIRFRSGKINNNNKENGNGTLTDTYQTNEMESGQSNSGMRDTYQGQYTSTRCQIIANKDGSGTLGKAGNFVSIAVVNNADTNNNDYVVMVWYDQHSKKLYYAYNENPLAGTTGVNTTDWTGVKEILSSGGEYCQIAVDKDGGIHIAAYDNGKVKYAFMQKFNSSTVTTCTVDSYDIIGQNLTLDVAYELDENGVGHNIPHIGYYALSRTLPKYAYLAKPASTDLNGADSSNYFTGVWETTYIPTKQTIPQDRINVGVFKQNGQRAYSTIGPNMFKANGTKGSSNTSAGSGTCYGNGTNNPVLGYAIKYESNKIYAEVAQLK